MKHENKRGNVFPALMVSRPNALLRLCTGVLLLTAPFTACSDWAEEAKNSRWWICRRTPRGTSWSRQGRRPCIRGTPRPS